MAITNPRGGYHSDRAQSYDRPELGSSYFDSDEFKSGKYAEAVRAAFERTGRPKGDYDHLADAIKYGLGARYAGQHIPYEELFQKPPPPPPPGEMSLSDFHKWIARNSLTLIDDLSDDSVVVVKDGKDLARFSKTRLAIKLGSQARVCYHIWETVNPFLKMQTYQGETATEQAEREKRQKRMDQITREAMERLLRQRAWATATGFEPSSPTRAPFTAEQRAGIEKARKVKRTMDATDNDGIRANARSALDTLLQKHGITEADL